MSLTMAEPRKRKKKKAPARYNVDLDPGLAERLTVWAHGQERSLRWAVNRAIKRLLEQVEGETPR